MTDFTLPALPGALDTVYHVDALALLAALPEGSVDCVVTSPPYDNLRTYNGYTFDFEAIARETYRVIKPGGVVVWVVGDATINGSETLTSMRQALYFVDTCGFRMWQTLIYEKDGLPFPPQKRYYSTSEYMFVLSKGVPITANIQLTSNAWAGTGSNPTHRQVDGELKSLGKTTITSHRPFTNIWRFNVGWMKTTTDKDAYEHPAMFPETLAERHILTWTNPGDLVLDYFGGSGTTAKMARKNGRRFLTCDISAEYCDLMRRRLSQPYTPSFMALLDAAQSPEPSATEAAA